jgi:peptidoglycan/xylan/chitin deacetylase (PgdA/CDA1 family)
MLHVSDEINRMTSHLLLKPKVVRCYKWLIRLSIVFFATGLWAQTTCDKSVYLTFDTGHMGIAPLVAQVLQRQQVRATFFLANEATKNGGSSLDDEWAPWWRARVAEGHQFGSHTYDHVYWLADLPGGGFKVKSSAGSKKGQTQIFTADQYCQSLDQVAERYKEMTGAQLSPIFRAAGGKTSPALLKVAKQCGYSHVGWSPNGFLGDELPSDRYPNNKLLEQALKNIKSGDILLAHLGIWSRQDPWAPAVLEPLIVGLKERGFCFKTINQHPQFKQPLKSTS